MQKLNNCRSALEAITQAQLAWSADPLELVTANGLPVPDHQAIVRSDTQNVLGVVGSKYQPIQNSTAFGFFDTICEKYGASYEFAGCLKGGRKVVVQARIPGSFDVRPGDQVDQYITLVNSHDGSTSLRAFFTPIRLFCLNQLNHAWRDRSAFVCLRHTQTIEERLNQAFAIFNLGLEYFAEFQEKAKALAQKVVDCQMVDRFLTEVMGEADSTRKQTQRIAVTSLFERGQGNGQGTAWDLYNGLTEYVDHFREPNEDKAMHSSLFGQGAILKQKAWEAAVTL